ncbi:hypothetical protein [Kitasatospora sp. Root107]|uniref:LppU/SCO3897 family protein n=1 Tax=Kitasatospora sp. Root107 TaxID=1736424 RepID=UPI000708A31A|nr:hypothetical protein [Kitasatospora sp. Root107]KQV13818.1 hypothetical protein ASC99_32885 [Kitasatospora sp. Root107]
MASPAPELPDTTEAEPFAEAAESAAPRRRWFGPGLRAALVIIVGAALALTAAAYFYKDDPKAAKAGDCVHSAGPDDDPDVTIVDCSAGDADLKVLKVIHGSNEKQCDTEPGLVATYTEKRTSSTVILCLGEIAPPKLPGNV